MRFYLDSTVLTDEILAKYEIEGVFGKSDLEVQQYRIDDDMIYHEDKVIGMKMVIDSPKAMDKAMDTDLDPEISMILIETGDWHIIPLENLIAKFHGTKVTLIAVASTPKEIELLENVLELGIEGCLLRPESSYSVEELLLQAAHKNESLELEGLTVDSVEKIGNGDRVCVDTVSILKSGEGLLVGSTAGVMALVQAEVEESGFVNARPFRINAGVVASYTLNFEKTNYLSELSAGSSVMIVDKEGRFRKEYIARVKIERRPLVVVRVNYENRSWPIILQDAETVKVLNSSGSVRIDQLKRGDTILGYVTNTGRHFGMAVDEFLEEK